MPESSPPTPSTGRNADEFYVGYLPLPAGQLRFVRILVPSLLWTLVLAASLMALVQRRPGDARWDTGHPTTRTGILIAEPYPMLLAEPDPSQSGSGPADLIFLTEIGKRGAQARTKSASGHRVALTGWTLQRDGRRILELSPDDDAVRPLGGAAVIPDLIEAGPADLRGEIVDYKCYLGAMKPGDGKAHKACAELCIAGGIPPVLVTQDDRLPGGGRRYFVLTGTGGAPANVAGMAGEPVRIRGSVRCLAGTEFLQIESIERAP